MNVLRILVISWILLISSNNSWIPILILRKLVISLLFKCNDSCCSWLSDFAEQNIHLKPRSEMAAALKHVGPFKTFLLWREFNAICCFQGIKKVSDLTSLRNFINFLGKHAKIWIFMCEKSENFCNLKLKLMRILRECKVVCDFMKRLKRGQAYFSQSRHRKADENFWFSYFYALVVEIFKFLHLLSRPKSLLVRI